MDGWMDVVRKKRKAGTQQQLQGGRVQQINNHRQTRIS